MHAKQTPSDPVGRPSRRTTPAERAAGFAATQVRLKQEAAARRAIAKESPRASGISHVGHGAQVAAAESRRRRSAG